MAATRKTVPLSALAEALLPHLTESLSAHIGAIETQVLTEAVTRGLITMVPRAWHDDPHQWGGLPLDRALAEIKYLVTPLLAFLADHDALAGVLKPYLQHLLDHTIHAPLVPDYRDGATVEESRIQQMMTEAIEDMSDLGFSMDLDDDDD